MRVDSVSACEHESMRRWAHGELDAGDDNVITWNVIGDELPVDVRDSESLYDAIAVLGRDGWEMVQFHRYLDSTTYWFKKRLDD